ncbi:MAG: pentapeptide repeat-containing protein [Bacteroidales bacterium]|nr:pentapeptide repeat-containing protein [Bacteroidales bacterium]
MTNDFIQFLDIFAKIAAVVAVVYALGKVFHYISHYKEKQNEEYTASFNTIIAQLSTDNQSSQLSAAILLRRFFDEKGKKGKKSLKDETINVISSLLRVLPTGIFQKTLGDGLAYAKDLSNSDLQKTNLQDIYLGSKSIRINLTGADLFGADLSYANLDNLSAKNAVFMGAILFNTKIKNSDLSCANFINADLKRVTLKNVTLYGADFSKAYNIPHIIKSNLVDGKYSSEDTVTVMPETNGKSIFFSVPGCMTKEEELLTKDYKRVLENMGYEIKDYIKDNYPKYGQLNDVRHRIEASDAMVVFGFRQIHITSGEYRINTPEAEQIDNKWLPTPWNEIEVGMGMMAGLPILLIKDDDINSGVFDKNLSECFVGTISSSLDCRKIDTNKEFISWRSKFSN